MGETDNFSCDYVYSLRFYDFVLFTFSHQYKLMYMYIHVYDNKTNGRNWQYK